VTSKLISSAEKADGVLDQGQIPVIVDPECSIARKIHPMILIDGILAKSNTGTSMEDAPIVIGLGPGFTAGKDVHAVIETKRGHDLGRVILDGTTQPNTGIPGDVAGYTHERVFRAPKAGVVKNCMETTRIRCWKYTPTTGAEKDENIEQLLSLEEPDNKTI